MRKPLFAGVACFVVSCLPIFAEGTPKIQFDQTVVDFGKTSLVDSVSGTFKFKNAGDGVLKLQPPAPSCGCTTAGVKPDTLQPGESGELPFTMNLGRYTTKLEKHITVKSNDPKTPEVVLTIKADYVTLYEISPSALAPTIPLGGKSTNELFTLKRNDGQALQIARFEPSKPWIKATVEPNGGDASMAKVRVEVEPDGAPRRFHEYLHLYTADHTNSPVTTLYIHGQLMGELTLSPEVLYWNVTDPEKFKTEHTEAVATRRVTIRSVHGKEFELKNPQSTIKGVKLQFVPKEAGKAYELVASVEDLPEKTISGTLSFETSLTTEPKLEMPMTISVLKR